ncbi:MAG: hypothetical protein ACM34I_07560 [bacterium]
MKKRLMSKSLLVVLLGVVLLVIGCAPSMYYKVTDPVTGSVYYTEEVQREKGGAATFKDARSGSVVTIQNSEIKEISEKEFDVGRYAPAAKPAAAPAAAPTQTPAAESMKAPAPEKEAAPAAGSMKETAPEEKTAPSEESK